MPNEHPDPPGGGIRARRRLALLEELHHAAVRQYRAHGYDGMSLRDICDEAGISFRTLFRHARGKDAILGYTIERQFARITERFRSRPREEPLLIAYRFAIDDLLGQSIADPEGARLTQQLLREVPGLRAQYLFVGEHAPDAMDQEFAQRLGRPVTDPRVSLLRTFLVAAVVKALAAWIADDMRGDLRALASEFLALLAPVELSIRVTAPTSE